MCPEDLSDDVESCTAPWPIAVTGDQFKTKTITSDEVDAAVDVFMPEASVSPFRFAGDHAPDPTAAVKPHEPAARATTDPGRMETYRRSMVRAAILLARPEAP